MLTLFVLVSIISFAGSLHPGTVNVAVAQTTLSQSRSAGLWQALGGSLPEFAYGGLAAGGLMLLPKNADWMEWLAYAPIPVLRGAGIASFYQKPVDLNHASESSTRLPFLKGLALGGTNPQLLPFWSAVWLYLSGNMLIPEHSATSQWIFALGTSAGAFGLLVGVAWLSHRQRERITRYVNGPWLNRLTGGFFIGMALWQFVRVFDF
jgi:threonine/homoserine/homoserine lactone efflux protein